TLRYARIASSRASCDATLSAEAMKREKLIGVRRNSFAFFMLRTSVRVTWTPGPAASTIALVLVTDVSSEPAACRSFTDREVHAASAAIMARASPANVGFESDIDIFYSQRLYDH